MYGKQPKVLMMLCDLSSNLVFFLSVFVSVGDRTEQSLRERRHFFHVDDQISLSLEYLPPAHAHAHALGLRPVHAHYATRDTPHHHHQQQQQPSPATTAATSPTPTTPAATTALANGTEETKEKTANDSSPSALRGEAEAGEDGSLAAASRHTDSEKEKERKRHEEEAKVINDLLRILPLLCL